MLGTIVLVFMLQQNHFMQKSHRTSHCAQYTHKKYETYSIIVRCCFFSLNKTTYIHHNINISATGSTHLKSSPTLKGTHRGCKQYTILARGPFMQTMKMCTVHT